MRLCKEKIYQTLLVSIFSSTLVINALGDVFDVTKETGDGNIGKLVEKLKTNPQNGCGYTKQFGEVIKEYQKEFRNIVIKCIASKIDKDNLNELLIQTVEDKTKLKIKTLELDEGGQ